MRPSSSGADAARERSSLVLPDGCRVLVRAISPEDSSRLRAFHSQLSAETIYRRFFTSVPELTLEMARRLAHVDYENRMALVATTGAAQDEQIIAVVRYERTGSTSAEVALVVTDNWQGRGIGTALLYRLAGYARRHGIVTLTASTMAENRPMINLLRACGFPSVWSYSHAELDVQLDISRPLESVCRAS
jgi:GNAT superfamily N-acetyltransferase